VAKDTSIKGMSGKPMIGVIGGTKSVGIDKFIVGYIERARAIDPMSRSRSPIPTVSAIRRSGFRWRKPCSKAARTSSPGRRRNRPFILAAEEIGKFAIGVDTDQDGVAPGAVLTSMIKRTDVGVETVMKEYAEKKFPAARLSYWVWRRIGVDLSPMKDSCPNSHQGRRAEKQNPFRRHQGLERCRSGLSRLLQIGHECST
jgi:basic membrane protein A and related proteins